MDLNETYDIEAEIEAELAKIPDDEVILSDNENDETVDVTRVSDIVTEGWSSEEATPGTSPEKKTTGSGTQETEPVTSLDEVSLIFYCYLFKHWNCSCFCFSMNSTCITPVSLFENFGLISLWLQLFVLAATMTLKKNNVE